MAANEEDEIDNKCMKYVVICARWGLVVVLLALVLCSYYLYVVVLCMLTISNMAEKVFFLLIFHVFAILFLWSYFTTIFTRVRTTPAEFYPPPDVLRKRQRAKTTEEKNAILLDFVQDLPIVCTTKSGDVRYCELCKAVKPDRSHHCSVCKRCVLKMDHHCPWTNTCISFTNYKYFQLVLFYATLYTSFMFLTSIGEFNQIWSSYDVQRSNLHSFEIVLLFFASLCVATVVIPLYAFHLVLTMLNLTTLDMYRANVFASGAKSNQFNLGCCKNFKSVFGDKPWLWFVPIFSSKGDGVTFPLRGDEDLEAQPLLEDHPTEEVGVEPNPNNQGHPTEEVGVESSPNPNNQGHV